MFWIKHGHGYTLCGAIANDLARNIFGAIGIDAIGIDSARNIFAIGIDAIGIDTIGIDTIGNDTIADDTNTNYEQTLSGPVKRVKGHQSEKWRSGLVVNALH